MTNIEHWEAAQRERNARALDAEFTERAHAEQAAIIRRLTEESRTLQQQLRGAVEALQEVKGELEIMLANEAAMPVRLANTLLQTVNRALAAAGGQ